MTPPSIRARLTIWYLAVLTIATLVLAAGSSWLVRRSVVDAADASLRARVDGVRQFIESAASLAPDELHDEFREFAALTLGAAQLEVIDGAGASLYQSTAPGWENLRAGRPDAAGPRSLVFSDRVLGGVPARVAEIRLSIGGQSYDVTAALPMAAAYDALARFRWLLAGLVPAVLLLAGFGGYAISRRALAPVDRMTRAAQVITVRNLDSRIDVPPADDELRRLAVTFNDMLARLQGAVAEMTRLTAEASHELRTPVALIRATAEVAIGRDRPAADYRQALVDVLDHAERMSTLVGDLLVLARADAGVEPRETTPVDLTQVARDAVQDVRASAIRAGVSCELDAPAGPVDLSGSPDSLRRLVVILLDNAIKYSQAGGRVVTVVRTASPEPGVGGGAGGAHAVLEVIDTGIGIDAAERPHVFDRFYRGAAARAAVADGSGLGLAIARTIVTRHGGSIDIAPAVSGGASGTRVRVVLPRP